MSRQVVLDTETTGLHLEQGHRIIEVGCVELVNRRLTGRRLQHYLNPDRDIDAGAQEIHGISKEFLADKPRFHQIEEELMAFLEGAELITHNAPFDLCFLNHELSQTDSPRQSLPEQCPVLDTLTIAREKHPAQSNSLDALCKRYGVDNTQRELHGALLDAEILAEVYLLMTSGQSDLSLAADQATPRQAAKTRPIDSSRPPLPVTRATPEELAAHEARLKSIAATSKSGCLWLELEDTS